MSELSAQNSDAKYNKNFIIMNSSDNNKRKRKNSVNSETMAKQQICNNYYSILDNDIDCSAEYLKKFKQHVQNNNNINSPSTSRNGSQSINTREKSNLSSESTSKLSQNYKNFPPLNIYDVDRNELIQFITNGLKIKQFKIKEFRSKK